MIHVRPLASLDTYPRGKFVVLDCLGELHLVMGPVNLFPFHANLVYEYLERQGRAQAVMTDGSHCRVLAPGWQVLGGGQYRLDDLTHTAVFNDKSTAYGKYPVQLLERENDVLPGLLGLPGWALEWG